MVRVYRIEVEFTNSLIPFVDWDVYPFEKTFSNILSFGFHIGRIVIEEDPDGELHCSDRLPSA